jgi:hypothetical protein
MPSKAPRNVTVDPNLWTRERFRTERPPVIRVLLADGTEVDGQITGYKMAFPRVSVTLHGSHFQTEVTWQTVLKAINTKTPIRV